MRALEIIITIPLLFFLPGYVLFKSRLFSAEQMDWLSRLLLVVGASAAAGALVALFLGEVGYLKLWLLDLILAVAVLAAWLIFGNTHRKLLENWPRWLEVAIVVAICILAIIMFFRPFEYVSGDADPGFYYNSGYHIAHTGAVMITDKSVPSMSDAEMNIFFLARIAQFTPFHVRSRATGRLEPQLYDMLPIWVGLFIILFGKFGGLFAVPLFAVLSVLALYALARRFTGVFGAAAAAVLLCLIFPESYFARMPVSELLAQFFLIAAALLFLQFLSTRCVVTGLTVAGLSTVAATIRPEGVIIFIPILLVMAGTMFTRKYKLGDYVMVNASLAAMVYVWLYIMRAEYHYIGRNTGKFIKLFGTRHAMTLFMEIWLAAIGLTLIVFNLPVVHRFLRRAWLKLTAVTGKYTLWDYHAFNFLLAAGVLLSYIYFYFIGPARATIASSPQNFFFYTSEYFGGIAVFIFIIGLCWLIFKSDQAGFSLLISIGVVLFALAFSGAMKTNGYQPWLSRRYMTMVVPMLVLGFGYLAGRLWDSRRVGLRTAALVGTASFVALFCYFLVPVFNFPQYRGIDRQVRALSAKTRGDIVIFTDPFLSDTLGIPMRIQYGADSKKAWDLSNTTTFAEVIRKYTGEGKTVLMETAGLPFTGAQPDIPSAVSFTKAFDFTVRFPRLSKSFTVIPQHTGIEKHVLTFFNVKPRAP